MHHYEKRRWYCQECKGTFYRGIPKCPVCGFEGRSAPRERRPMTVVEHEDELMARVGL